MKSDAFKCVVCKADSLETQENSLACKLCEQVYPIEDGFPVLLPEWQNLESQLREARNVSPIWYKDEQPAEKVSPWRHHLKKRREYVQSAISTYLKKKNVDRVENLLDLGCGDGNHLEYLSQYAKNVYGSDYNMIRLTRARAKNFKSKPNLFLADLLNYPIRDNYFDIIFFNHVLEHIKEDSKALQQVHRILKPGGLLVLGTPNEGAAWWQLAYRFQPEVLKTSDHVHFYTSKTLSKKVEQSKLKVVDVRHLGWGPPHWRLDGMVRKYKLVDDAFEFLGRRVAPHQASSLYILGTK